jgi:uncharacterized protein YbjT (DUF2867 family)
MDTTLVVGATGQLGTAVTKNLLARGSAVRALVRDPISAAKFQSRGAGAVMGDLTDPATLQAACAGITTVVATANAAIPTRASDTFEAVERNGYRYLIQAACDAGVKRFVYTSGRVSKHERSSKFFRFKRETEQRLAASGLNYVIFRADIFMDVAFAMMGSMIPVRGAESATILRPFQFTSRHVERIKGSIEGKRVAMIPGDGRARHAFICVDDVAAFLAAAVYGGPSGTHDIGGPEALTFPDVVRIYERILGFEVRLKRAPAVVFRIASAVLKPFSPAAGNLMLLNYMGATEDTLPDSAGAAAAFRVQLTSAESFLRSKSSLASAAAHGQ